MAPQSGASIATGKVVKSAMQASLDYAGLASDSREVKPGYLFAALSGSKADGAAFDDGHAPEQPGIVFRDQLRAIGQHQVAHFPMRIVHPLSGINNRSALNRHASVRSARRTRASQRRGRPAESRS